MMSPEHKRLFEAMKPSDRLDRQIRNKLFLEEAAQMVCLMEKEHRARSLGHETE
jgi:hypothetical protein